MPHKYTSIGYLSSPSLTLNATRGRGHKHWPTPLSVLHDLRQIMVRITAQSEIVVIEDIYPIYHMILPIMLSIHLERSSNE